MHKHINRLPRNEFRFQTRPAHFATLLAHQERKPTVYYERISSNVAAIQMQTYKNKNKHLRNQSIVPNSSLHCLEYTSTYSLMQIILLNKPQS